MESALQQARSTYGIVLFSTTEHSNFAVTHPDMYLYLPTELQGMKNTEQREANSILVYNTESLYQNVLKWWYLCALTEECLAPTLHRFCNFTNKNRFHDYVGCHRYDQAALNLLLINWLEFDDKSYFRKQKIITIHRYPARKLELKICPTSESKS